MQSRPVPISNIEARDSKPRDENASGSGINQLNEAVGPSSFNSSDRGRLFAGIVSPGLVCERVALVANTATKSG